MAQTIEQTTQTVQAPVMPARYLFTVEDYERMAELGILREGDRLELICGEIIQMSPIGTRHAACVDELTRLFVTFFGRSAKVSVQNPFVLGGRSKPQPDLAVVRSRADRYKTALPTSPDVMLLVEVSDSTLAFDRNTKLPLYAEADIPEVWIVNISGKTIEIYTAPTGGAYAPPQIVKRGESFTSPTIPGLTLSADDILL